MVKRNPNNMMNKFGNNNLYFFIAILHYAENLGVRGDFDSHRGSVGV